MSPGSPTQPKPLVEIRSLPEWREADADMVILVKAASATVNATVAGSQQRKDAQAALEALSDHWTNLKALGVKLVDMSIASSATIKALREAAAELKASAGKIAAATQSIQNVTKLIGDLTKVAGQVGSLLGILSGL
jgi:hypothetical protein